MSNQLNEFENIDDDDGDIRPVLSDRNFNKKLQLELSKDEVPIEPPARSNRSIKIKMPVRNSAVAVAQPVKAGEGSEIGLTSRKSEEILDSGRQVKSPTANKLEHLPINHQNKQGEAIELFKRSATFKATASS